MKYLLKNNKFSENFPIGNDDTERNQIQIEQIKIKNDFLR